MIISDIVWIQKTRGCHSDFVCRVNYSFINNFGLDILEQDQIPISCNGERVMVKMMFLPADFSTESVLYCNEITLAQLKLNAGEKYSISYIPSFHSLEIIKGLMRSE